MPLEEAIRTIQIAERARQGRLRATFMKQIYLEEKRERLARLTGEKALDIDGAVLFIQKVKYLLFNQRYIAMKMECMFSCLWEKIIIYI